MRTCGLARAAAGMILGLSVVCAAPALAQQQFEFEYAVKFLCGQSDGNVVSIAPGTYGTAINIHNPEERGLELRYKVVVAPPGGVPGEPSGFRNLRIGPDGAVDLSCRDFRDRSWGTALTEGFLVLQSPAELDVVAVYTAISSTRNVAFDVERIPARTMRR